MTYAQAAAGELHTVLLKSDGTVVAFGFMFAGALNIPALEAGLRYTQVAAGARHTVLLRSDGTATAIGYSNVGQCNIPALPIGRCFTVAFPSTRVLRAVCLDSGDGVLIRLLNMSGEEHCHLVVPANTASGIVLDRCLTAINDTRASVAVIVMGIHDRFRIRRARR